MGTLLTKEIRESLDALLDSVSDDELLTALTGNASPCDFSVIEHHRDHLDWKRLGNLLSVPSGAESINNPISVFIETLGKAVVTSLATPTITYFFDERLPQIEQGFVEFFSSSYPYNRMKSTGTYLEVQR